MMEIKEPRGGVEPKECDITETLETNLAGERGCMLSLVKCSLINALHVLLIHGAKHYSTVFYIYFIN